MAIDEHSLNPHWSAHFWLLPRQKAKSSDGALAPISGLASWI